MSHVHVRRRVRRDTLSYAGCHTHNEMLVSYAFARTQTEQRLTLMAIRVCQLKRAIASRNRCDYIVKCVRTCDGYDDGHKLLWIGMSYGLKKPSQCMETVLLVGIFRAYPDASAASTVG